MGWFDDLFGGSEEQTTTQQNDIRQLPDYEESTGARENWWDTLQSWGSQPGYGAITPNFKDIWESVKQKVQQYYHGGPMGGGAIAGLESNAAKRNMSDQPAMNRQIGRYGAQEGQQLQDIAIQQAIQEASMSEKGRTDWLRSMEQLAGLKPSFTNYGTTQTSTKETQDSPLANAIALGDYFNPKSTYDLSNLFGTSQGSISGKEGSAGGGNIDANTIMKLAPMLLSLI